MPMPDHTGMPKPDKNRQTGLGWRANASCRPEKADHAVWDWQANARLEKADWSGIGGPMPDWKRQTNLGLVCQ